MLSTHPEGIHEHQALTARAVIPQHEDRKNELRFNQRPTKRC